MDYINKFKTSQCWNFLYLLFFSSDAVFMRSTGRAKTWLFLFFNSNMFLNAYNSICIHFHKNTTNFSLGRREGVRSTDEMMEPSCSSCIEPTSGHEAC
jgi:hypothetical protein